VGERQTRKILMEQDLYGSSSAPGPPTTEGRSVSQTALICRLQRARIALLDIRALLSEYASRGELGDLGVELAANINGAQQLVDQAEHEWREWEAAQWRRLRLEQALRRGEVRH